MVDFITEFKNKAHNKTLTSSDMLALAIYKAVKAKSNKEEALNGLIKKSFTKGKICAHRKYPYQAVTNASNDLRFDFNDRFQFDPVQKERVRVEGNIFNIKKSELMSEDELTLFNDFVKVSYEFSINDYMKEFA